MSEHEPLKVTRSLSLTDLYATEVHVSEPDEFGMTIAICQTDEEQETADQIDLTWEAWEAISEHVNQIGNPDTGTLEKEWDDAVAAVRLIPQWLRSEVRQRIDAEFTASEPVENNAQRNVGRPGGQCRAHNDRGVWCWLPAGHEAVSWRTGVVSTTPVAGHVTEAGELFWEHE